VWLVCFDNPHEKVALLVTYAVALAYNSWFAAHSPLATAEVHYNITPTLWRFFTVPTPTYVFLGGLMYFYCCTVCVSQPPLVNRDSEDDPRLARTWHLIIIIIIIIIMYCILLHYVVHVPTYGATKHGGRTLRVWDTRCNYRNVY